MKPEILREYAELKIKEKSIKARIEELNPVIKKELVSAGLDKLPTNLGDFSIKKVKRWTYTEDIGFLKMGLDAAMERQQADGTATFVEVEQLEFRELKNESNN